MPSVSRGRQLRHTTAANPAGVSWYSLVYAVISDDKQRVHQPRLRWPVTRPRSAQISTEGQLVGCYWAGLLASRLTISCAEGSSLASLTVARRMTWDTKDHAAMAIDERDSFASRSSPLPGVFQVLGFPYHRRGKCVHRKRCCFGSRA